MSNFTGLEIEINYNKMTFRVFELTCVLIGIAKPNYSEWGCSDHNRGGGVSKFKLPQSLPLPAKTDNLTFLTGIALAVLYLSEKHT